MLMFFEYVFISYGTILTKHRFLSLPYAVDFYMFKLYFHTIVFKSSFLPPKKWFVCLSWDMSWWEEIVGSFFIWNIVR